MANRIALSGKPLAGKTTLAHLLRDNYGYHYASMSNIIVDEFVSQLNARNEYQITAFDIHQSKERYRSFLQVIGDELGFQDSNRIVGLMQRALQRAGAWNHPEDPVVLEAIRGDLQASAARALGFVIVELWVDEETQHSRATDPRALQENVLARPDIEQGTITNPTIRLTPALTPEDMATLLVSLPAERGLSRGPANQPFKPGSLEDWHTCCLQRVGQDSQYSI